MRAYFGSDQDGPFVSLSDGGRVLAFERGGPLEDCLRLYAQAIETAELSGRAPDEIAVDAGPGGFSAVRRRVAAAASLAWAFGVPVAPVSGLSAEKAALLPSSRFAETRRIVPKYDKPPNITKSKKPWNAVRKR